jgi:tetratricopeptide (TPR) repeat protein
MRLSLLLLLFVAFVNAIGLPGGSPDGSSHRIDSLKGLLNSPDLELRFAGQFGIAYELFDVDNKEAVVFSDSAFHSALLLSDSLRIVKAGRLYGQLLRRTGAMEDAVKVFLAVVDIAGRHSADEYGRILNALSLTYTFQSRYDKAFMYSLRLLRLQEQTGDRRKIGQAEVAVGMAYYSMGIFSQAAEYFKRATACPDSSVQSNAYMDLALTHLYLDRTQEFEYLERLAWEFCPVDGRDQLRMFLTGARALYLEKIGLFEEAMESAIVSLKESRRMGDTRMTAECLLVISRCKERFGDFGGALKLLDSVDYDLQRSGFDGIRLRYYGQSADLFEKLGKMSMANTYRKKYIHLKDSAFDQEVLNRVAVARLEFEERENRLKLEKQGELLALYKEVMSRQRWLGVLLALLSVAGFALAISLRRIYRLQKQISLELDQKVSERTRDLLASESILVRQVGEQRALMALLSSKMRSIVATMTGLRSIICLHDFEPRKMVDGIDRVNIELHQLSDFIDRPKSIEVVFDQSRDTVD